MQILSAAGTFCPSLTSMSFFCRCQQKDRPKLLFMDWTNMYYVGQRYIALIPLQTNPCSIKKEYIFPDQPLIIIASMSCLVHPTREQKGILFLFFWSLINLGLASYYKRCPLVVIPTIYVVLLSFLGNKGHYSEYSTACQGAAHIHVVVSFCDRASVFNSSSQLMLIF